MVGSGVGMGGGWGETEGEAWGGWGEGDGQVRALDWGEVVEKR